MQDDAWNGYNAAALGLHGLTRGAPVLQFAGPGLQQDKTLVCFLVWSNPTNLCFASPALQADADVVAAALASPFYAEPPPPVAPTCVLRFADEELRASKDIVLAAMARSPYEFQFASEALRADAYVAAWAGAPVGSFRSRELSKTFVRVLKADCSVEYMDAYWKSIMSDNDCGATRLGDRTLSDLLSQWPNLPLDDPRTSFRPDTSTKHSVCALVKHTLDARCPLCLRVAPPARELLWPTREEWDGVF
jgi:hypothetical protein